MFSSPLVRKFGRLALASAAVGTATALLLLGAPADAATVSGALHAASRGI